MSDTEKLVLSSPAYSGLFHIALFGKKGSGKTIMFRSLTSEASIGVNSVTPNIGICDLGKNGKAILVDTASLNSTVELQHSHMKQVRDTVRRADIAIYVVDIRNFDRAAYEDDLAWMQRNQVDHLLVFNKCDIAYAGDIANLKLEFPQALFLSAQAPDSIALLRTRIGQLLHHQRMQEPPLLPDHLVSAGDFAILVLPDTNARAIRNPERLMHELLGRGARCVTCHQRDLKQTIQDLPQAKLVVAYASTFDAIRDIVPEHIRLTSYALLYGRQKGDLDAFADGARKISSLTEDSRVLIAEGCHHGSMAHRDIGRVIIPRTLRHAVGENLRIDYSVGPDLPENIDKYDLVIHCGGCSLSRRTMQAHLAICQEAGIPVANFSTVLAEKNGILDRCINDLK